MDELDIVVLTNDFPTSRLEHGDVGTVVHRYDVDAFEVEFLSGAGDTVAVLTLTGNDVRPLTAHEILHARVRR